MANKRETTETPSTLYARWRILERDHAYERNKLMASIAVRGPYLILHVSEDNNGIIVVKDTAVAAFTNESTALKFAGAFGDLVEKKHNNTVRVWLSEQCMLHSCSDIIGDVDPTSVDGTYIIYKNAIHCTKRQDTTDKKVMVGGRKIDVFYAT